MIELMVTIAVLALLMMAVGPSIGAWVNNTRIRNVAQSIQAGMQRARLEAVRRNQPVRFTLVSLADSAVMDDGCVASGNGVSWVVSFNDPAGKCSQAASDTTDPMIVEKFAGGVGGRTVAVNALLADLSASASTITFDGFGRVSNAGPIGVVNVDDVNPGNDYRALRLTIGTGGTVRMCEPKVTSISDPRHC